MQAQASGNSAGGTSALQNPKVQIAVIVVGLLAVIGVVWMLFFSNPSSGGATVPAGSIGNGPGADAIPGGAPAGNGPGDSPAMNAPSGGNGPGMMPAAAPAPAAGAPGKPGEKSAQGPAPGNRRANPFAENKEIKGIEETIPKPPDYSEYSPDHSLYAELRKPKPLTGANTDDDTLEGPPVPPMRVAAIVQGSDRLSAMIQMGSEYMTVIPGNMIPSNNPVFRVESIEPTKVRLSRKWTIGDRSGLQKIEVPLAHGASSAQPAYAPPGGYPGAASPYGPRPGAGGNGP